MDIYFALQSDSDGSPLTGQAASVTVYLSIDGAAFTASTNSAAEIGLGAYKVTLTSAEASFTTLLYAPVCTGAQSNIYQLDAAPAIPTAQNIWEYSTRTLTSSSLTAQQVWEYSTRTLTASPTDISSLATSIDISNAQTAIINAMPVPPSASTIATTVINTSVLDRDTHSLGSTVLAISGYTDEVESKIDTISTKLTDLPIVRSLLDRWVVDGTALTCYDSEGSTLESCTLTKDANGNIVAVTPNE